MVENRSCKSCLVLASSSQQETDWPYMFSGKRPLPLEISGSDACHQETKLPKLFSNDTSRYESSSDLDVLIQPIGRDNSINCLIRCSRSYYGSIASLNRSFRSVIRSGEIYKSRRQKGVTEHWVYFSCDLLQWEAFDPIQCKWMHLPPMPPNGCFIFGDKESLAVGTELLVFGKELNSQVIYRYSILTNSWTFGTSMNSPRCLFGSASLGEIAILAGGCDSQGNILSTAEMYNSETQKWETLPSMNIPRKMCSGVFMDKKFYVIGGTGGVGNDARVLTCGEEYDLELKKWTKIPNMSVAAGEAEQPVAPGAPPLVAVVNNELYAADHADMEVKKYDKEKKSWLTIGRLPERAVSMNGWGLAFRACGDRLIVIGGQTASGGSFIELNSWVPSEGPPQWNLLARKRSADDGVCFFSICNTFNSLAKPGQIPVRVGKVLPPRLSSSTRLASSSLQLNPRDIGYSFSIVLVSQAAFEL
ncbi:hypothetical protein Goshw_006242 [Gossypium schwendimanii]|uniref:Uncharacterized protein n=1 Tax=Gossypium schwendimanii TaxID=34291 RepID=A0A7J9N8E0_GOSSC|nr:hypothetical protein [Gossypium schwendimanii]